MEEQWKCIHYWKDAEKSGNRKRKTTRKVKVVDLKLLRKTLIRKI